MCNSAISRCHQNVWLCVSIAKKCMGTRNSLVVKLLKSNSEIKKIGQSIWHFLFTLSFFSKFKFAFYAHIHRLQNPIKLVLTISTDANRRSWNNSIAYYILFYNFLRLIKADLMYLGKLMEFWTEALYNVWASFFQNDRFSVNLNVLLDLVV